MPHEQVDRSTGWRAGMAELSTGPHALLEAPEFRSCDASQQFGLPGPLDLSVQRAWQTLEQPPNHLRKTLHL
jgi:hypothetical protein